jgi:hypothetical protein
VLPDSLINVKRKIEANTKEIIKIIKVFAKIVKPKRLAIAISPCGSTKTVPL